MFPHLSDEVLQCDVQPLFPQAHLYLDSVFKDLVNILFRANVISYLYQNKENAAYILSFKLYQGFYVIYVKSHVIESADFSKCLRDRRNLMANSKVTQFKKMRSRARDQPPNT